MKKPIFVLGLTTGSLALGFIAPKTKDQKNQVPFKTHMLRIDTQSTSPRFFLSKSALGPDVEERLDARSQKIRLISGELSDQKAETKEEYLTIIKDYIDRYRNVFGITWDDLKLVEDAVYIGEDEQFFKFHVYRQQIRIEEANVDFRFKRGLLVQIATQTFSEAALSEELQTQAVSVNELKKKVLFLTKDLKPKILPKNKTYRVVPEENGYRLVPTSNFELVLPSGQTQIMSLNSQTKEVFEWKENIYYLGGQARTEVYPRWYTESLVLAPHKLAEIQKSDNSSLLTDYSGYFDLDSSLKAPKLSFLKGRHVEVKPVSGSPGIEGVGVLQQGQWALDLIRKDSGLAQVDKETAQKMVYFHTTQIVQEAKRFVDTPWLNRPLTANTNVASTCNAHWDGQTINLYNGDNRCANTGLISDVIYHEWGHGLDDKTGGIEDGAFSEGYGDILSLLMTNSSKLGIGFHLPRYEPVRDLDADKRYPEDQGEVHDEGLIIGTTFWDLLKAFESRYGIEEAQERLKAFAFRMIFTARTYLDVYDAILVIDDDDQNLANGTPNMCLINQVFAAHGLREKDRRCEAILLDRMEFEDQNHNQVIEPGETIDLKVFVKNNSPADWNSLQGQIDFINFPQGSWLTDHSLNYGPMAKGEISAQLDSLSFKIDPQTPCGTKFFTHLSLDRSNSERLNANSLFTIGRSIGQKRTMEADGLPSPILDKKTTLSKISLTAEEAVAQSKVSHMTVTFALQHSYLGDLVIHLISPDGEQLLLYRGEGRGKGISFSKDITELVKNKPFLGDWTLKIFDRAASDEGSLTQFSITAQPSVFSCEK